MDSQVALVVVIISLAFFGEAIFGFGAGLVSVTLLSLFLGVRDAVSLVLLFQLSMGLLIFKTYHRVNWKVARSLSGGLVVGTIIGTLFLSRANTIFLELLLAAFIIVFLIRMLFFKKLTVSNTGNKAVTGSVGLGTGLFQGLIGSGGQILIMYLSSVLPKKETLRATLIYLFFVTSVIRLVISVPEGLMTPRVLHLAVITMPFFLVAIVLGQILHDRVKERYYQVAVYAVLSVSAILLVAKSLNQ